MYQSVTFSDFVDAFRVMDRRDQFSYDGLRALFDYIEEYEDSTGESIELDVIALCCEYSEYGSAVECATEFGWARDPDLDDEENAEDALDWLRDRTIVIEHDSGIIIQDF